MNEGPSYMLSITRKNIYIIIVAHIVNIYS